MLQNTRCKMRKSNVFVSPSENIGPPILNRPQMPLDPFAGTQAYNNTENRHTESTEPSQRAAPTDKAL
jgi:hypothetical protein